MKPCKVLNILLVSRNSLKHVNVSKVINRFYVQIILLLLYVNCLITLLITFPCRGKFIIFCFASCLISYHTYPIFCVYLTLDIFYHWLSIQATHMICCLNTRPLPIIYRYKTNYRCLFIK